MEEDNIYQFFPVHFMLHETQSAVNFGQIFRICDMFHMWLDVYDPRGIFQDDEKRKTIHDFSVGALNRLRDFMVLDFDVYRQNMQGRMIATCLEEDSVKLNDFTFQPHDVVFMGNEYDGLPQHLIDEADVKLYIPLPPGEAPKPRSFSPIDENRTAQVNQVGVPNLSLSMSCAIIAYALQVQREGMPTYHELVEQLKNK